MESPGSVCISFWMWVWRFRAGTSVLPHWTASNRASWMNMYWSSVWKNKSSILMKFKKTNLFQIYIMIHFIHKRHVENDEVSYILITQISAASVCIYDEHIWHVPLKLMLKKLNTEIPEFFRKKVEVSSKNKNEISLFFHWTFTHVVLNYI